MTRYEFEILQLLTETGAVPYSVRSLSDSLLISGNQIISTIESLTASNLIATPNNTLSITPDGINSLEPYRVKKAIILAAGFGSRMMPATSDRPKPMVSVNGKRIIESLLDALIESEVDNITVIGGYKFDSLNELKIKYPNIQLVNNTNYDKENNISSIMKVVDNLNERCYICEADLLISNPKVIKKYQYSTNILASYVQETDDWCFNMQNGCIENYRKGGTYCYNYYGISFWDESDCLKLQNDYKKYYNSPNGKDLFWEFVPFIEEHNKYNVEIRPCHKEDIMEIDNYYELQQLDPDNYK